MKIPPKFTAAFGLYTTILLAVGIGGIQLPLGIPHDWLDIIKSWCMFAGAINSAILTGGAAFSAAGKGPLAPALTINDARDIMTQAGAGPRTAKPAEPLKLPPAPSV